MNVYALSSNMKRVNFIHKFLYPTLQSVLHTLAMLGTHTDRPKRERHNFL